MRRASRRRARPRAAGGREPGFRVEGASEERSAARASPRCRGLARCARLPLGPVPGEEVDSSSSSAASNATSASGSSPTSTVNASSINWSPSSMLPCRQRVTPREAATRARSCVAPIRRTARTRLAGGARPCPVGRRPPRARLHARADDARSSGSSASTTALERPLRIVSRRERRRSLGCAHEPVSRAT